MLDADDISFVVSISAVLLGLFCPVLLPFLFLQPFFPNDDHVRVVIWGYYAGRSAKNYDECSVRIANCEFRAKEALDICAFAASKVAELKELESLGRLESKALLLDAVGVAERTIEHYYDTESQHDDAVWWGRVVMVFMIYFTSGWVILFFKILYNRVQAQNAADRRDRAH